MRHCVCVHAVLQPVPVRDRFRINYVMEMIWHRVFGEPWVMEKQNFTRIFPKGEPFQTPYPSPTITATPTQTSEPYWLRDV